MGTVEEIKTAIVELPQGEYNELRKWFSDTDWRQWDTQIENDSRSGRLDFLKEEAIRESGEGTLKEL